MGVDDPELTAFESELQLPGAAEGRGHVPADGVAEPATAPPDPASASNAPSREALPAPEPAPAVSDAE